MAFWKREQRSAIVKSWMRKKNIAVFLFFLLYLLAESIALYETYVGTFIPTQIVLIFTSLPLVFLTLFFANVLIRLTGNKVSRFFKDELEPEQRIFMAKMYSLLIYAAAVAFLLYSFGMTASSLATFLGFVAIGLALAVREPVLSFFIWMIVLSKKPFRTGDHIRIGNYMGRVARIGTFYLTLDDGSRMDQQGREAYEVKVPNKYLIDSYIENFGQKTAVHALEIPIRKIPRGLATELDKIRRTAEKRAPVKDVTIKPQDKPLLVVIFEADAERLHEIKKDITIAIYENHTMVRP